MMSQSRLSREHAFCAGNKRKRWLTKRSAAKELGMDGATEVSNTEPPPTNEEKPEVQQQEEKTGPAVISVESDETPQQPQEEEEKEKKKAPSDDILQEDGVPHKVVPTKTLSEEDEEET